MALDSKKKVPIQMRCIRTIKAGFDKSGKSIIYSSKSASKELAPFEFQCRKCLPCRLKIGREKAIRALHEARMHKESIFLTLTYNEENLHSDKLCYPEFQLFMKKLLKHVNKDIKCKENRIKIPFMVTGEYGEKNKRPHWHVLLFNYRPDDAKSIRATGTPNECWTSETITKLWGKGNCEFGSVTIDSASYVGRYAAKKLVHGSDQEHDFHPVHKTSSAHVIGKSWIQKYWKQTFRHGYVTLPNGSKSSIPRYYVDWLKKHQPEEYFHYVSEVLPATIALASEQAKKEETEFLQNLETYQGGTSYPQTRTQVKHTILKSKFKTQQERLKL